VQERLLLLFETFLKVRTAAQVMRVFVGRGLALPRRDRHGDLRWQPEAPLSMEGLGRSHLKYRESVHKNLRVVERTGGSW
jgi:hypothetical protein